MAVSTAGGAHAGSDSGGCGGGADTFNQAAFNAAMSSAEEDGCGCEGMDENEAAHEGEAAGCGEHLTVAERIDQLEDQIAELEESGDASPEELQALRKELLSLANMEGHDQATTERLGYLEERLDELTMQA